MRREETQFTVLHEELAVYTDHTNKAADYLRDDFTVTLTAAGKLFIGFHKPFRQVYIETTAPNTNTSELTINTYRAGSFSAPSFSVDETLGFSRSGFIYLDSDEDWEATTVNGLNKYWLELSVDADTSAMDLRGINVVFADDHQLEQYEPEISRFIPNNKTSFISFQVAAKNHIIQKIRNVGNRKVKDNMYKNITAFDFLDYDEINTAAIFLALSFIFDSTSDRSGGDIYSKKGQRYYKNFEVAFNLAHLSLDLDDDGTIDASENLKTSKSKYMSR